MAGNVLVQHVSGEAHVTGDNLGNGIRIQEISSNTYRVTGLNHAGAATTVNGKAFHDIVTRDDDLRVNMGRGNDYVLIGNNTGTMTVEDLTIDLGDGADYLGLLNLEVYDRFDAAKINAGQESNFDGADNIEMRNVTFRASVDIVMGAGADEVEMRNVFIRKELSINTGSGNDEVELVGVTADKFFLSLGSGNDTLELEKVKASRMVADGGLGKNRLEIRTGNQLGSRSFTRF